MAKFKQVHPNEWQMPVMNGYKMACCDCGLVHILDFKVIDENDHEKEIDNVRVLFKADRNNRSTAQIRRHQFKTE